MQAERARHARLVTEANSSLSGRRVPVQSLRLAARDHTAPALSLASVTARSRVPCPRSVHLPPACMAPPRLSASQQPSMLFQPRMICLLSPWPRPRHSVWHTTPCRPAGTVPGRGRGGATTSREPVLLRAPHEVLCSPRSARWRLISPERRGRNLPEQGRRGGRPPPPARQTPRPQLRFSASVTPDSATFRDADGLSRVRWCREGRPGVATEAEGLEETRVPGR